MMMMVVVMMMMMMQFLYLSAYQQQVACNRRALKVSITEARLSLELVTN
jgi:hypothetical protein